MPLTDWYIEGPSFGNCSCRYGCPCQFEDVPSHGYCEGFEVLRITRGHFGALDLGGLHAALIYAWPGPIYAGGGAMQVVVDERATPDQRHALISVLEGEETEEAATHWWVYRAMCDTVHPPLFLPFDYSVDIEARRASVTIPGLLRATGRPIEAPHGGGPHRVRIEIPGGIEFTRAEIGSASTHATGAIPLELTDSYGQWTMLRHGPQGVRTG
ncbi:DUF1326 domain-containing protein [Thioclava sp. BHET1]|nr:DUF1326 domain-containing protein [Thioclava sp. BHET1]